MLNLKLNLYYLQINQITEKCQLKTQKLFFLILMTGSSCPRKLLSYIISKMRAKSNLKRIQHFISMPFIYGMIFPSLTFHIFLEIYHQVCFRLYGITLVNSKKYFIYDRVALKNLNLIEKINCIYCSYVNNLIRYSAEVGGRTERYWCPLKYEREVENTHSQYEKFIKDGACEEIQEKWAELRDFSDLN